MYSSVNYFHRWVSLAAAAVLCLGLASRAQAARTLNPFERATTNIQVPVLLRPADRGHSDVFGGLNGDHLPTGRIFAAVFTGTAGPGIPVVEITSTRCDRTTSAFGLNADYTYRLIATLRIRGEVHVLNASGSEHQVGRRDPDAHAQLACERATVDLAKQVQTLIVLGQHTGHSDPGEFRARRKY